MKQQEAIDLLLSGLTSEVIEQFISYEQAVQAADHLAKLLDDAGYNYFRPEPFSVILVG